MAKTYEDVLATFSPKDQADIRAGTRKLMAEYATITDLRKARNKTQVNVAKELKVQQSTVSRLEKQTDMKLSTLRQYIEAIGGELELVARFPEEGALTIKGLEKL